MNTFQLTITSYNEVLYKGPATHCGIITPDGSLGLEAKHEPVLAVLKEDSLLTYKDASGNDNSVHIENGMLTFKNNECTITVSTIKKE